MPFTRLLDLAVFVLVAVAILLPRPDVKVQVGLDLAPIQRVELAELQAQLLQTPGALEPGDRRCVCDWQLVAAAANLAQRCRSRASWI